MSSIEVAIASYKEKLAYLSMTVIIGATVVAAVAPEIKSAANRRPRFFVFHTRTSVNGSFKAAFVTVLADVSSWTCCDPGADIAGYYSCISSSLMVDMSMRSPASFAQKYRRIGDQLWNCLIRNLEM